MAAIVMSGAPVAEAALAEVAQLVEQLGQKGKSVGLGTVLVGDDPASVHYVARKHETSERYGIVSVDVRVPATGSQADLLDAVDRLNNDPLVDGFLVQNPVPEGFDYAEAVARVRPSKDVDGLNPANLGYLALGERGHPRPCTPLGIQAMLSYYEVPVEGRSVVVVGRGPTLGRPLAMLLSLKEPGANAAVTVVHTGVKEWAEHTRRADIVVGAAGVPNMITPDVVAPGSCVIGGGITWEGRRVLSDVDERCAEVAGWVTPRLGGVGVTTVAMLLRNTAQAAAAAAARAA
ncbi:MAG TPA: tetrahydrofolate dehydrogenase/cyclohydrolase catalytic domain-containing protein [Acidimicrobiales bacterium]|nr:tetrahydrofolate dehydrogenase/cyclohydrolase catalytic domain-containing protein [Acidimicrobiales bacterium]